MTIEQAMEIFYENTTFQLYSSEYDELENALKIIIAKNENVV